MLDLGSSINVIPYSIYASLNLGEHIETNVAIELADRCNAYSKGVLEGFLMLVNEPVPPPPPAPPISIFLIWMIIHLLCQLRYF